MQKYSFYFIGIVVGFEEPWYTVFEGTGSAQVCVGVVQGITDFAVGK